MSKCGMGCDAEAERGGFYCEACLSRWDREDENRRRKKVEAEQAKDIRHLRDEVVELKHRLQKKEAPHE